MDYVSQATLLPIDSKSGSLKSAIAKERARKSNDDLFRAFTFIGIYVLNTSLLFTQIFSINYTTSTFYTASRRIFQPGS
jgi:hypothetical protein